MDFIVLKKSIHEETDSICKNETYTDIIVFQNSYITDQEFVNNQIYLTKRKYIYIYKFVICILLIKFRNILD